MKLHRYQENCLADLREFFAKTKEAGSPKAAFAAMHDYERRYYPPPHLADSVPYICVRIPTGGGKTLLAAHAAGVAAKEYLHSGNPTIVWLAPSDAIVSQTLRALQNRDHPCRRALTAAFGDAECISAKQALSVSKADMDGAATIIVGTVQSLRVEKTAGRKMYDDNDSLMAHFDSLSENARARLEKHEDSGIKYSLANVLSARRPLVISDEAHNSGTSLSFESLERINPSCILEFTATPQIENLPRQKSPKYASNVISQASARELKEAGMIKFPLHFEVLANWRENIRAAINKRDKLEKIAAKEKKQTGEYIRPIVLYQAENVGGEAGAEIVRETLQNDFDIPAEQIAVHTGTTRELQKQATDLFSDKCDLRHIITVQALAEGWDCSFAYILCTMANWHSPRAVEQILGRILRLPNARKKDSSALNECYAFAAKGDFYNVAAALKDTLINKSGFQRMETDDFVQPPPRESGGLFNPDGIAPPPPNARKIKPLAVPMLMVCESGGLAFLEAAHFLGIKWSIAREKPDIAKFSPPKTATGKGKVDAKESGEISVHSESVEELRGQLMLLEADKKWTESSLAAWLDAEIPHPDIPQSQSSPYILAAVRQLAKKYAIKKLARWRFYLREFLKKEMDTLRKKRSAKGLQQILKNITADGEKLEVSAERALVFARERYAARECCPNGNIFGKHLFPEVGELKDGGEEFECARHLDGIPEMEVWVRNLDQRENSFWLQTSSDKFYPDFVCRLKDGRILVVEYKGEDRWSNDDSEEKRALGEMWAKLSGGKCLFVMPKGKDWNAIRNAVNKK